MRTNQDDYTNPETPSKVQFNKQEFIRKMKCHNSTCCAVNEINVQSIVYWKVRKLNNTILLNKQFYKQINSKDIYKQYTMNEINVQSVVYWKVRKLNNTILLNKQCYKQINPKDIHKQYTMNEINVQSVVYWKVRKVRRLSN